MSASVIIGLGYGDEGKGLVTSYLCSQKPNPIVVRFSGGHQAGHTVVRDGKRHVFSSFGAGTLQHVPTVWSHYCTFSPVAFMNEWHILKKMLDQAPRIYVHALCPVTTPYDIYFNRVAEESVKSFGSVGVGFGATHQRHESFFKLHVQDLFYDNILHQKLKHISEYYGYKEIFDADNAYSLGYFVGCVRELRKKIVVINSYDFLSGYDPVFEGSQGIMLDQDFGFFPNVTRSHTTSRNALSIYPGIKDVYYVTRTYQTRHGKGYMTNEDQPPLELLNNLNETNREDKYQGKFRITPLDIDLLNYALECDYNYSSMAGKNLVITCADQTDHEFPVTINGVVQMTTAKKLPALIKATFKRTYISYGDSSEDLQINMSYFPAENNLSPSK